MTPTCCAPSAHANDDPEAAILALDARLGKIGAPKVEGTDKAGDKSVAGLYFGPARSTTTTTA